MEEALRARSLVCLLAFLGCSGGGSNQPTPRKASYTFSPASIAATVNAESPVCSADNWCWWSRCAENSRSQLTWTQISSGARGGATASTVALLLQVAVRPGNRNAAIQAKHLYGHRKRLANPVTGLARLLLPCSLVYPRPSDQLADVPTRRRRGRLSDFSL